MATELGRLVRDGPKRATAGLLSDYADGSEPMPAAGDYSVILDGDGAPLCVIQTTAVEVRRFGDVDEQFAWTEGEGDRSLAYWRDAHIQFFASIGAPVSDDTEAGVGALRPGVAYPRRRGFLAGVLDAILVQRRLRSGGGRVAYLEQDPIAVTGQLRPPELDRGRSVGVERKPHHRPRVEPDQAQLQAQRSGLLLELFEIVVGHDRS